MLTAIKRWIGGRSEARAMTLEDWLRRKLDGVPAAAGVPVTVQRALGLSALWCGVKVISEAVGMMPLVLYQKTAAGRERAEADDLYPVLHDEPNPEQTRPVFFETLQSHCLLHGNGYAEIERNGDGSARHLWICHPTRTRPDRDPAGRLVYKVQGVPGQPPATIPAADMLHVPGLGPDGSVGYELLEYGRDTIGFALAAQLYGASWFKNAGRPGGILEVAGQLSPEQQETLRRSWQQLHAGADNAGRVAVLEQGTKFSPFTPTNEQAQYRELLLFFVYEVARLLNIQPSKLHDLAKATWGNLETMNQDFLTTTLQPWLTKWEAEVKKKCLPAAVKRVRYCEFLTDVIIRTDYKTRVEGLNKLTGGPILTVNEARRLENLPPIDGGDSLRLPPSAPTPTAPPPADAPDPNTPPAGDPPADTPPATDLDTPPAEGSSNES